MVDAVVPEPTVPAGNIVLTGFMGTGKTAVGRALAALLRREFVDTDAAIEAEHGPIPSIFRDHGEAAFRAHEAELAAELAARDNLVVSTGGGMLVDEAVADRLAGTGRIFCLAASPATVLTRVRQQGLADRPLIDVADPEARITELLAERAAAYARFERVPTDGRSVRDVVADLIERLRTPAS